MIDKHLFLCLALGICILLYTIYVFRFYGAYSLAKIRPSTESTKKGISVVIAARNELPNLKRNLSKWLGQQKEEFEIVVVNDRSWDGTRDYLEEAVLINPRLSVSNIEETTNYKYGKKFALTVGIKKAKYQNILITDADTFPNDNSVLREVSKHFDSGDNLILGYSPLAEAKGVLGFIQKCEHFMTAVSYYGFAKIGKPYMGVGRFLGYTRELYENVKGFKSHYHLPFGDDDLFVQSTKGKSKVGLVNPNRRINTYAKPTWVGWLQQRKRHFAASRFYHKNFKFLLSLPSLLNVAFYTLVVLAFLIGLNHEIILGFIAGRLFLGSLIGFLNGRYFGSPVLGVFMPFWEIIIFIIHPFIYLSALVKPNKYW